MTPLLFHGPEARDRAVRTSLELGRPVSDPVGDGGLKVDDSRIIVEMSEHSGVGDRPPSLVIGPLDQATPEAADALLKTLEDLSEGPLRLTLWADHISGVIPTIRSRTHSVWCPAGKTYLNPLSHLEGNAKALCQSIFSQDPVRIMGSLEDSGKDWSDLLQALQIELALHIEGVNHKLVLKAWERIRDLSDGKGSLIVAVDALLPESMT